MIQTKHRDKLERVTVDEDGTILVDGEPAKLRAHTNGYLIFNVGKWGGATFRAHRVIAWKLFGDAMDQRFPRLAALLGDGVGWDVAHKNRNRTDNRPENLMWCPRPFNSKHSIPCPLLYFIKSKTREPDRLTPEQRSEAARRAWENNRYQERTLAKLRRGRDSEQARKRQRERTGRGMSHPCRKLTAEAVAELLHRRWEGASYRALGRAFGISSTQAHRIANGRRWLA